MEQIVKQSKKLNKQEIKILIITIYNLKQNIIQF